MKLNSMRVIRPVQLYQLEEAYKTAKEYADLNGIEIINVTRGGNLEIFKRSCLEDVLFGNVLRHAQEI